MFVRQGTSVLCVERNKRPPTRSQLSGPGRFSALTRERSHQMNGPVVGLIMSGIDFVMSFLY